MSSIDLIIFDCDGVLIDSETMVCEIAAQELTSLGYSISTDEVIRRFAGRPDREMRTEIEADWGQPIPHEYETRVNRRTEEAYARELRAMPGMAQAVRQIGLPKCVASSSYPSKLRLGLETTGLYDLFAPNIISGRLVAHGKPEPDVFIFAAGWMKVSPLKCMVVEDSVPGTTAAKSAGMRVIGFEGGSHCRPGHGNKLHMAGAELVFRDMEELPGILESLQDQEAAA